jgi:RNA polymerase sigma-70 factor (ECF subfamily)
MNERTSQTPTNAVMDEAELRSQLEEHHLASYGWAMSCCRDDRELAEDALQSAYLKILQGRARYHGAASFRTWLFAVIRLTAGDERRRKWFRQLRLRNLERQETRDPVEATYGDALDGTARLIAFQQALARLPARQRQILHLVFYQDLTLQEASEVMGVAVGSARTHYERGKHALRAWLEKSVYFDEYGIRESAQRIIR